MAMATISAQVARAVTVSGQLELAYDPAELRGKGGEWIKDPTKAQWTAIDAREGRIRGEPSSGQDYGDSVRAHEAVREFASKAAGKVPGLLGGGHSDYTGRTELFRGADRPSLLAEMGWDGTMRVQDGVAKSIRNAADDPDTTILKPLAFSVMLHELIHSTVPDGQKFAQHSGAYQDKNAAMIEEGFTELGTIHHMPEFADAIGVGDRKTAEPVFSDHGAVSGRATVAEYAKQLQSPSRISGGNAWGPYPKQTAAAQQWTRRVAMEEAVNAKAGKLKADAMANGATGTVVQGRMRELADQVNQQGPAGKALAMAKQVMSAADVPDRESDGMMLSGRISQAIKQNWQMGNSGPAFQTAVKLAQAPAGTP